MTELTACNMPLKRTPPSTPTSLSSSPAPNMSQTSTQPTHTAGSILRQTIDGTPSLLNVTHRKPKQLNIETKLDDFMNDMRQLFADFKEKIEKKTDQMYAAIEGMRTIIDSLDERCSSLQTQVSVLVSARQEDQNIIKALEEKLELHDRHSRSTCIEVRNVPTVSTETKPSLLQTVLNIGKHLKVPFQASEVKDVYRVKTKNPANKTIIVDFISTLLKENIVTAYRNYTKGHQKLTTEVLQISGTSQPVYISENLTAKMKRLHFLARDFAKSNGYKFCWVSRGKIFLRKVDKGPLVNVANQADLDSLWKPT